MEIYLRCFFKALAIRKVMGWGEEAKALKKNPVKVLRNTQNLPCHQHKKIPSQAKMENCI